MGTGQSAGRNLVWLNRGILHRLLLQAMPRAEVGPVLSMMVPMMPVSGRRDVGQRIM